MIKYENQCVDCGLPCLGRSCPNRNVAVYYCDTCGDECGECYEIDSEDYCEDCARQYLRGYFDDLSLDEQAELLDIGIKEVR